MTQLSWDEEKAQSHLEVRSEGDWVTIKIEGDVARSQKDWVYWRLPTCITKQAVSPAEGGVELAVRLEKGEARVGLIAESVKPGENWHEEKMRDAAFFLDPFFGVLRAGDRDIASGPALKASQGDTITVIFHPAEALFLVNGKEVGRVPIAQPRPMRLAAQMWDKGDAVRLVGQHSSGGQAMRSPGVSPIKARETPGRPSQSFLQPGTPKVSTPAASPGKGGGESTPGGGDSQMSGRKMLEEDAEDAAAAFG
ncbi:hypothetical protein T484DRAFT_1886142, partial [Baffinella frigidus]